MGMWWTFLGRLHTGNTMIWPFLWFCANISFPVQCSQWWWKVFSALSLLDEFSWTLFCCGVKAYRKLRARQARDDQRWRDTRDLVINESLARRAYLALHAHVPHPCLRSPNLNTQDKQVVHAGRCGKSCKRKKLAWFLLKPSVWNFKT